MELDCVFQDLMVVCAKASAMMCATILIAPSQIGSKPDGWSAALLRRPQHASPLLLILTQASGIAAEEAVAPRTPFAERAQGRRC